MNVNYKMNSLDNFDHQQVISLWLPTFIQTDLRVRPTKAYHKQQTKLPLLKLLSCACFTACFSMFKTFMFGTDQQVGTQEGRGSSPVCIPPSSAYPWLHVEDWSNTAESVGITGGFSHGTFLWWDPTAVCHLQNCRAPISKIVESRKLKEAMNNVLDTICLKLWELHSTIIGSWSRKWRICTYTRLENPWRTEPSKWQRRRHAKGKRWKALWPNKAGLAKHTPFLLSIIQPNMGHSKIQYMPIHPDVVQGGASAFAAAPFASAPFPVPWVHAGNPEITSPAHQSFFILQNTALRPFQGSCNAYGQKAADCFRK